MIYCITFIKFLSIYLCAYFIMLSAFIIMCSAFLIMWWELYTTCLYFLQFSLPNGGFSLCGTTLPWLDRTFLYKYIFFIIRCIVFITFAFFIMECTFSICNIIFNTWYALSMMYALSMYFLLCGTQYALYGV